MRRKHYSNSQLYREYNMALKKDKQKVLGEHFDDERVKSFLVGEARGNENLDFILLERAYRGMKADNFTSFVRFFVEDKRDVNAKNLQGETFLSVIQNQRHAAQYITALKEHGAK